MSTGGGTGTPDTEQQLLVDETGTTFVRHYTTVGGETRTRDTTLDGEEYEAQGDVRPWEESDTGPAESPGEESPGESPNVPFGDQAFAVSVAANILGTGDVDTGQLVHSDHDDSPNSLASLDVPGVLTTGNVSTGADPTSAGTASAAVEELTVGVGGVIEVTGNVLSASCNPPTVTLAGLAASVGGLPVTLPVDPAPNTTVSLEVLGVQIASLTLNEQVDGTVNALHLELLGGVVGAVGEGDVIVASATCVEGVA